MKTLLVMRHAKSSWDDPNWSDFERPLNLRGLRAARNIGEIMKERVLKPQLLISSPATRARQTAELVIEHAELGLPLRFDERIYEASTLTLFNLIREFDDRYSSAMIFGHNPGFEQLVGTLTGQPLVMRTANLAVITLATENWSEIEPRSGSLSEVILPPKDAVD